MSDAPETSKRLQAFEKMTQSGSDDPMAWYGLAMEYRRLGRLDDAVSAFTTLRDRHEAYVPAYLMCAQALAEGGRGADARAWAERGVEVARGKRDSHALSELESFLAGLD